MTSNLDLDKVLGTPVQATFAGGGYIDDLVVLEEATLDVEKLSLNGTLRYPRSFLAGSAQGHHLSAITLQALLDDACRCLARCVLRERDASLAAWIVRSATQRFLHPVVRRAGVPFSVAVKATNDASWQLSYRIEEPDGEVAFAGDVHADVIVGGARDATRGVQVPPIALSEGYQLHDVVFDENAKSIGARVESTARHGPGYVVYAAAVTLMRALYAQLLCSDRSDMLLARAREVRQRTSLSDLGRSFVMRVHAHNQVMLLPHHRSEIAVVRAEACVDAAYQMTVDVVCPTEAFSATSFSALVSKFQVRARGR